MIRRLLVLALLVTVVLPVHDPRPASAHRTDLRFAIAVHTLELVPPNPTVPPNPVRLLVVSDLPPLAVIDAIAIPTDPCRLGEIIRAGLVAIADSAADSSGDVHVGPWATALGSDSPDFIPSPVDDDIRVNDAAGVYEAYFDDPVIHVDQRTIPTDPCRLTVRLDDQSSLTVRVDRLKVNADIVRFTDPPVVKPQCKHGGWKQFLVVRTFKNQGDCIQFVKTGK